MLRFGRNRSDAGPRGTPSDGGTTPPLTRDEGAGEAPGPAQGERTTLDRASAPSPRRLRLAVGLATAGRPDMARWTLTQLTMQSRMPDAVFASVPSIADIGLEATRFAGLKLLIGARGLTRQRNAILDQLAEFDLVCFIDDDFVLDAGYLAAMERAFLRDPSLAGATGTVLADGITGPGYSIATAERILAEAQKPGSASRPVYSAYGCNMVFSLHAIRAGMLRFDERLPRYGWLEDLDFSRRVARMGRLDRIEDALGVHLGVKGGRQSGLCFGYSQIANPLYLVRKGSYAWYRAGWLMGRNVAMNVLRAARPEPHVDRRGRIAGNLAAITDLLRRRLHPERIESLS